jgi:hypothetical protein
MKTNAYLRMTRTRSFRAMRPAATTKTITSTNLLKHWQDWKCNNIITFEILTSWDLMTFNHAVVNSIIARISNHYIDHSRSNPSNKKTRSASNICSVVVNTSTHDTHMLHNRRACVLFTRPTNRRSAEACTLEAGT